MRAAHVPEGLALVAVAFVVDVSIVMVADDGDNNGAGVDNKEGKLAARVDNAKIPRPGRGDHVVDQKFGAVLLQAEDGIRVLVRSRGLGDVYKRQVPGYAIISTCGI